MTSEYQSKTDKSVFGDSAAIPRSGLRRAIKELFVERYAVCVLILLAFGLRLAVVSLFQSTPASDGLAYLNMATSMLRTGVMNDGLGFVAYYSAGYPLFLIPFMAIFGESPFVIEVVNVFLGTGAVLLVYACAKEVFDDWKWAIIPAFLWTTYPPALFTTEYIGKENLSVPIVLATIYLLLIYRKSESRNILPLSAGLLFGCGMLVSTSTILTGAVVAAVIGGVTFDGWKVDVSRLRPFALLWCVIGCLIAITPWLSYTGYRLGKPVLSTGGGFNLYLGNNPNATGFYVGIQDTPVASRWPEIKKNSDEITAMSYLKDLALTHMRENPGKTIWLSIKKFGYLWLPPSLEKNSEDRSFLKYLVKRAWFVFYSIIFLFFSLNLFFIRKMNRNHLVIVSYIFLYLAIHVLVVIMLRYRLTIMPLMSILAVCGFQHSYFWWQRVRRSIVGGRKSAA